MPLSGLHSGIQFRWGKIEQMVFVICVGLERFWFIFSLLHVPIILCIECEYVDVHLVFFYCVVFHHTMGLDRVLLVSFQGGARLC